MQICCGLQSRLVIELTICMFRSPHCFQIAFLVGKTKDDVWSTMQKYSPLLNQLQQKGEATTEVLPDLEARWEQDWSKTAENLISLIEKIDKDQVKP